MVQLVAGKILRKTEMKFEGAEKELSLLLKKNIMYDQTFGCE